MQNMNVIYCEYDLMKRKVKNSDKKSTERKRCSQHSMTQVSSELVHTVMPHD